MQSWDEIRYELTSKNDGKLALCLIEGNKGWRDFHYDDVVLKWKTLKERLTKAVNLRISRFPEY